MSLPNYQSWKNRKLYVEMQGGPTPYIPSTERNPVGNGLRQPEPPKQQAEFSQSKETAPSLQNGGPVRPSEDSGDWYKGILSKFQSDIHKTAPERKASLGDLGMKGVSDATFGKADGATSPGDTPLVSNGVTVTDLKGQFESAIMEPPVGINPAEQPPAPSMDPMAALGKAAQYPAVQVILKKLDQVPVGVLKQLQMYLPQVVAQKLAGRTSESQADILGRRQMMNMRQAVRGTWGQ